jgi:hypothetical protein
LKSPENKNKLVINEEIAPIIREIFELFIDDKTYIQIAKTLYERKIPTPSDYFLNTFGQSVPTPTKNWNSSCVKIILKNEIYIGTLISNRKSQYFYDNIPQKATPKEEIIVTKGIVPAIIELETWKNVQEKLRIIKAEKPNCNKNFYNPKNIFRGLVKCGNCGLKMEFNANRMNYRCPKEIPKCKNYISFSELETTVKTALQKQISLCVDYKNVLDKATEKQTKKTKTQYKKRERTISLNLLKKKKIDIMNDFLDKKISEKDFKLDNNKVKKQIKELETEIDNEKIDEIRSVLPKEKKLEEFIELAELYDYNADIYKEVIDKILVFPDKNIEIFFNYKNKLEEIRNKKI